MNFKDKRKNFLLEQYHECAEQYRLHNKQFWQMPSVSTLLVSAIIGVAYTYITDLIVRTFLLLLGACMAFVMGIVLIKLRFFQYGMVLTLEKIEDELQIEHVQWRTNRGPNKPCNWLERRKAFNWFIGLQFLMFVLLAMLFILSLITIKQTYWN